MFVSCTHDKYLQGMSSFKTVSGENIIVHWVPQIKDLQIQVLNASC